MGFHKKKKNKTTEEKTSESTWITKIGKVTDISGHI